MRLVATTLNVLLALVYPFAVWWSLSHFGAREVGLVLIAVLLPALALRFRSAERAHLWPVLRLPLLVMGVLLLGVLFDDARYVLATPVLINLALLAAFASSLFGEMPIVDFLVEVNRRLGTSVAVITHNAVIADMERPH